MKVATSVDTGITYQEELENVFENVKMEIEGMAEENLKLRAELRFQEEENQKVENHRRGQKQALLDCEEKLRSRILEDEYLKNQITETNEKLSADQKEVRRMIHRNFELRVRYIR